VKAQEPTATPALISLESVSYAYLKDDAPEDPAERGWEDLNIIFDETDLEIPAGMVSVLGPNGTGKTTLLLLISGRIQPLQGTVTIAGINAARFEQALQNQAVEEERNRLVSMVYQNMEFETDQPLRELLAEIQAASKPAWLAADLQKRRIELLAEMIPALSLAEALEKRPQEMAKGELQKAVIAMALCWGSPIMVMDEPVFSLDEPAKKACFRFLKRFAHELGVSIIYSAHDFELCRDYADHSVLLWRKQDQLHSATGPADEICSRAMLEEAYQAPMDILHRRETLYREMLEKKS